METSQIIFYIFLSAASLQAFYFLFFYLRLSFFKPNTDKALSLPVSIIVCARNEEKNLIKNLPKLFEQAYENYEVIVVDDCSWDDSQDILGAYQVQYKNLKVVTMQENAHFTGGKKYAVALGLKAAEYEHILLTDADCEPASNNWLAEMTASFANKKEIILGYGAYAKQKGLLNMLVRFDTFMIAVQYFSYALTGLPYMGVGRNLAYKKELFFKIKGFAKHQHIASGDDDLFINQVANKKNTTIVMELSGHTVSQPPTTFNQWKKQKQRHLTTAPHYKFLHKFLLVLWSFSYYVLLIFAILLLVLKFEVYAALGVLLARSCLQIIVFLKPAQKLLTTDLLIFTPLLELLLMCFYPIFAVGNVTGNKKNRKWKR